MKPEIKRGRSFTIEGTDGSGKKTITKLMIQRLKQEGYKVETLDFPHDDPNAENLYAQFCRDYLAGKYGPLDRNHPLLVANLYANDRFQSKKLIEKWLTQGKNILFDRYVESNFAHRH